MQIANLDKQSEKAEENNQDSDITDAEEEIDKELDNSDISLDEKLFNDAGFNEEEIGSIKNVIQLWIADIFAIEMLTQSETYHAMWDEFYENSGISEEGFLSMVAKEAFVKMGMTEKELFSSDTKVHTANTSGKTTIEFKKYNDKIKVEAVFNNWNYVEGKPYNATVSVKYTIETEKGKKYVSTSQTITYKEVEKISTSIQKIFKKELETGHKLYFNDTKGQKKEKEWKENYIHNSLKPKFLGALTDNTINSLMKRKKGSFSDNIFIIKTNNGNNNANSNADNNTNKTKVSIHCPVDVYVYNHSGNLCGSVVNNQLTTDGTGEIFLYCVDAAKYLILVGGNYRIQFIGNDTGVMNYQIEEYEGDKLVRTLVYEDVKLEPELEYTANIPKAQLADKEVYNLISMETAEAILATIDTKTEDKVEEPSDDKEDDKNNNDDNNNINTGGSSGSGYYPDVNTNKDTNKEDETNTNKPIEEEKEPIEETTDKKEEDTNKEEIRKPIPFDETFQTLRLKGSKSTKTTNKLVWGKVKEADGYVVYGAKCNTKDKTYKMKKLVVIKDNKTNTYTDKGLKQNTYYKYYAKPYKLINGKKVFLGKSKTIRLATNGKYSNPSSVKVNVKEVTLNSKDTFTLKATQVIDSKKIKNYKTIQFESSNTKVAIVNKNGTITAKKKGTATIYVYAQNGIYTKVTVTVK